MAKVRVEFLYGMRRRRIRIKKVSSRKNCFDDMLGNFLPDAHEIRGYDNCKR